MFIQMYIHISEYIYIYLHMYILAGTGGSNAQGRALNKMLLEILRDRMVDPNRLAMAIDANIERMDCVNLATLLFHTGKNDRNSIHNAIIKMARNCVKIQNMYKSN
jgi:5-carboxymethyl-2-hydroxymuconate isomerase